MDAVLERKLLRVGGVERVARRNLIDRQHSGSTADRHPVRIELILVVVGTIAHQSREAHTDDPARTSTRQWRRCARAPGSTALERVRDRHSRREPIVRIDRKRVGGIRSAVVVIVRITQVRAEVAIPVVRHVGARTRIRTVRDLVGVRILVEVFVQRNAVRTRARRYRAATVVAGLEDIDDAQLQIRDPDRARHRIGNTLHGNVDRESTKVREQRLGRQDFRPGWVECDAVDGAVDAANQQIVGELIREVRSGVLRHPCRPARKGRERSVGRRIAVVTLDRVTGGDRRLRIRRVESVRAIGTGRVRMAAVVAVAEQVH